MNIKDKDLLVLYSKNALNPGFIAFNSLNNSVTYSPKTPMILRVQYPVSTGRTSIIHFRLHADAFPDGNKRYLAAGSTPDALVWTTKLPEPWSLDRDESLVFGVPHSLGFYRQGSWIKHLRTPLYFYSLEEFSQTYPDAQLPLCHPSDVETLTSTNPKFRLPDIRQGVRMGLKRTKQFSSFTWMIIFGAGILVLILLFVFYFRSSKPAPKSLPPPPTAAVATATAAVATTLPKSPAPKSPVE